MAPLKQYGTQLVKRAVISAAGTGNTTLVAAVTGHKIRVRSLVLVSGGTTNVTFQSGAGGTALTGAIPLVANTGFSSGIDDEGHFETASATLLNINVSGAGVSVFGWLTYYEVPASA